MAVNATACVVDTSALVAMLMREPEALPIVDTLGFFPYRIVPPSCLVELCSLRRLEIDPRTWLRDFLTEYEAAVLPMDERIAWIAASAAKAFGRDSGHPAKLNFGDCMSYAFARHLDCPLLFKGDDFTHTDITPAFPVKP